MKLLATLVLGLAAAAAAHAQAPAAPGRFDFYLLNIVPASEFCAIKDVGPTCATPQKPWVLHGLWPQYNSGTYPAFCAERPGPTHPAHNLDLTPDATLLDHEWKKHGTCTTLKPEKFFAAERRAFTRFRVPIALQQTSAPAMKPSGILAAFAAANRGVPAESLVLWCSQGRVTSVSECLSKDLHPIACQGLKSCTDDTVVIATPRVN